ncbi:MAG TPA: hypothetical protein VF544_01380 [Pyrinomonadaceae bacterium]
MSSDEEQARALAERIARRISGHAADAPAPASGKDEVGTELARMRASLSELEQKLARIESHLTGEEKSPGDESPQPGTTPVVRSPWLSGMYFPAATHPSQERFGVEEAAVSELVDYFEREKTCNLEPGGKPCDHCAMCSSRGF